MLSIIFSLFISMASSQDEQHLASLKQRITAAGSDAERIQAYSSLADYYSLFKLNRQSDGILQKVFFNARLSN